MVPNFNFPRIFIALSPLYLPSTVKEYSDPNPPDTLTGPSKPNFLSPIVPMRPSRPGSASKKIPPLNTFKSSYFISMPPLASIGSRTIIFPGPLTSPSIKRAGIYFLCMYLLANTKKVRYIPALFKLNDNDLESA